MSRRVMRTVYRFDKLIARKLSSSISVCLFTSVRRQQHSTARQMFNIYRLDAQGTYYVQRDDAILCYLTWLCIKPVEEKAAY